VPIFAEKRKSLQIMILKVLKELVSDGMLSGYHLDRIRTIPGDNKTHLTDKITLKFPNGKSLIITGFSSGVLENIDIDLELQ
jgi:hypothetical protein